MAQKSHGVDQVISELRRVDVELGKGKKVPKFCRLIGIAEQTYDRWRQSTAAGNRRWREGSKLCGKRNVRLKKMVANQALDMEILKEAAKGNW